MPQTSSSAERRAEGGRHATAAPAPRRPFRLTLVAVFAAFVLMALLQWGIQELLPWMVPWQSHGIAGAFAALCVAGAAGCFEARERRLRERTLAEVRERRRAEEKLHATETHHRTLFHNLPVGLYRSQVAPVDKTIMANPAIVDMFGYPSAQEFLAADRAEHFADPRARVALEEQLVRDGRAEGVEIRFRRRDGAAFWATVTAMTVRDAAGRVQFVDGTVQDITRRKLAELERDEANRRLEVLAATDALTGLLNRRTVLERLREELDRCRRHGRRLTIVMADIDHFKQVNDGHGHLGGDRVLADLGRRIQANCRPYDIAGRYGGEEFLLVLPETDAQHARQVAERIRRNVAAPAIALESGKPLTITASFGVAEADAHHVESNEALIARADEALSRAKQLGRDHVAVAPPASLPDRAPAPSCAD